MANNVQGVKNSCESLIKFESIEPRSTNLVQGIHLVEGYNNLDAEAINASDTTNCGISQEIQRCIPCLVALNCGCNLRQRVAKTTSVVVANQFVGNSTENSVLHPVNLIVSQHFYNLTNYT
jgi:hypothetical protein